MLAAVAPPMLAVVNTSAGKLSAAVGANVTDAGRQAGSAQHTTNNKCTCCAILVGGNPT